MVRNALENAGEVGRAAQRLRYVVNRGPKGKAQTSRGRAAREARSELPMWRQAKCAVRRGRERIQKATFPRQTRCRRLFIE